MQNVTAKLELERASAEADRRRATLARYAPFRVGSMGRELCAHDGTLIADTDTRELAELIVKLLNRDADNLARTSETHPDLAALRARMS